MAGFDLPNAQLPVLAPLAASHEENQIEAELKAMCLDMWARHAAAKAFDLNVSGMAHLGSFEQVRQAVNADGLALLPGGGQEDRTRYLYRAWIARNHRGRGLHFLRTYLQMLFPNVAKVEQLWMPLNGIYPQDAVSILLEEKFIVPLISDDNGLTLDDTWEVGGMIDTSKQGEQGEWEFDTSGLFLTNRVRITLDFSVDVSGLGNLLQIVRSVLPVRFVPEFNYVIEVQAPVQVQSFAQIDVEIAPAITLAHPDLLMVTDDPDVMWELGSDDDPDNAPFLVSGAAEIALEF